MFVHYYTHVPVSLSTVEARIEEIRAHLDDWAGVAYRDGEELFASVGPGQGGYAKKVSSTSEWPRSVGQASSTR